MHHDERARAGAKRILESRLSQLTRPLLSQAHFYFNLCQASMHTGKPTAHSTDRPINLDV